MLSFNDTWVQVFKNGPSKICGRQPLKKFEEADYTPLLGIIFVPYIPG